MQSVVPVCPSCGEPLPWSSPRLRVVCSRCWAPPPRPYDEPAYSFPQLAETWRRVLPHVARRAVRSDAALFGAALLAYAAAALLVVRLL